MIEFTQLDWFVTIPKVIALFLGIFIVYLAYTGYRRNRSKPLLYVALGFALITLATFAEGLIYALFSSDLRAAIAIGTAGTIVGFLAIIYSVYSAK